MPGAFGCGKTVISQAPKQLILHCEKSMQQKASQASHRQNLLLKLNLMGSFSPPRNLLGKDTFGENQSFRDTKTEKYS